MNRDPGLALSSGLPGGRERDVAVGRVRLQLDVHRGLALRTPPSPSTAASQDTHWVLNRRSLGVPHAGALTWLSVLPLLLRSSSSTQGYPKGSFSRFFAVCEYRQSTLGFKHLAPSPPARTRCAIQGVLVSTHERGAGRARPRAAGRSGPSRPLLRERSIDNPYPFLRLSAPLERFSLPFP